MIRIILIRHGRTAWNAGEGQGKRFRGTINLPLADEGVAQAQATAQRLAGLPLTAVYSSPLQRAARTAQMIAEFHGLAAEVVPDLVSMNYGKWAEQLDTDVARRWPDLYGRWCHDPFSVQIPGGEHMAQLRSRAVAALRAILARHTDGDFIGLVSHQAVTKTLVCALAGLPDPAYWCVRQDLCNLSRFDYDPTRDEFTLVGLNDTCHLDSALPTAISGGTRIILIRHGQTAWNEGAGEERFRGRTDLPLDDTGLAQARAVAKRLRHEPIEALFVSPLLRTRQTIAPLAAELGLPIQAHKGLLDIDYGRLQGLTRSRAAACFPELYRLWHTKPSQVRFPDGGSLHDIQSGLLALLGEMTAGHRGQVIALVGHQIVNKVLVCMLLDLELDQIWRVGQDTGGVSCFQQNDQGWQTLCLNDTCHLP